MNDKLDVNTGIKDTLPTVFGYIGIGLAFGIYSFVDSSKKGNERLNDKTTQQEKKKIWR